MNSGSTIFSQLVGFLSHYEFQKCVSRYDGEHKVKSFSCWDQYLCMAFAQLTYRESLRDIEACLHVAKDKLYHMGIRSKVSRNTLSNANMVRDWRIFADFGQELIAEARILYANEDFGVDLDETIYALDSTTIDLCLSLFPWAHFRKNKGAVKMHTLLDVRGSIPTLINITHGKIHDVNILDTLPLEAGSIYVMDRGYLDFARLHTIHLAGAFFVTRAKHNTQLRRLYSHPVEKSNGVQCDQTVIPRGLQSKKDYPVQLRRVRYFDSEQNRSLVYEQPFHAASSDNFRNLSLPLAGRVVLQMDQAAPPDQEILWEFRERGEDTNLDCDLCLRACCHSQETSEPGEQPLHNSTDSERYSLRENPDFTGIIKGSSQRASSRGLHTIESIQLTLGQQWYGIIFTWNSSGICPRRSKTSQSTGSPLSKRWRLSPILKGFS